MRRVINFTFLLAIAINFFLWYSGISLVGSIIKSFGDCDKEYKIEKYIKSDWFCQTEDSKIDTMLTRSEEARIKRRR